MILKANIKSNKGYRPFNQEPVFSWFQNIYGFKSSKIYQRRSFNIRPNLVKEGTKQKTQTYPCLYTNAYIIYVLHPSTNVYLNICTTIHISTSLDMYLYLCIYILVHIHVCTYSHSLCSLAYMNMCMFTCT